MRCSRKIIFLELIRNFCASIGRDLINRERLPLNSGRESSLLTRHNVDGLLSDQVTAGQQASLCQYWVMSNDRIWQDEMSAEGATVRMRLQIRRQDNPFARGTSCHTIEG
jgi:hypothetical protein